MSGYLAHERERHAVRDGMTPLEYGLVVAFMTMSLIAAVPILTRAATATAARVFDHIA